MNLADQKVYLAVAVDGASIDTTALYQTTSTLTYDQGVGSATIDWLYKPPGEPGKNAIVEIIAGVDGTGSTVRFRGRYKHTRVTNWPHVYSWVLRGMLDFSDRYQNTTASYDPADPTGDPDLGVPGLYLPDILGLGVKPNDNFSVYDSALISAVLGLAGQPGVGSVGGTGRAIGGPSWPDLTWRFYQSALDYVQNIDKVSLGYRTFEMNDGTIVRRQIIGSPGTGAGAVFSEGVDIFGGGTSDSGIENKYTGVVVHGYNYGKPAANRYISGTSPYRTFDSTLALQSNTADGPWLACQDIGDWILGEYNGEQISTVYTTYRGDVLNPGDPIGIYAPHLNLSQGLWVRGVTVNVRPDPPTFEQQLTCSGIVA